MGGWVLILNLIYFSQGVAVQRVEGFKTRAECERAGAAWRLSLDRKVTGYTVTVCVERTAGSDTGSLK